MHASNKEEHIGTGQQHLPNGCLTNERFYKHLIQCAPNVILFLSPDHLILEFNPEAERLYGRKREDVLGKDYFEEFLPDDAREAVAADIEKALTGRSTRGFENAVVTNDGQKRVLRWNIDSVLDSEGKASGVVAVGQDITEHQQSDSALNESLQASDDIVRTIPSGLFIYRYEAPDNLFLQYGNPEAERLTGIKVADCIGKEFNEIWPNAKEQGITDAFLSPMKTDQTYETEDLYYKDKKLEGAFRVRTFRLPGDKLAVAFENITERKKTELSLQESEERFRLIASSAQDAIVMADDQGSISYWNPAAERIFGYKKEETIGRNLAELMFPERLCEEFSQKIRAFGKTGTDPFVGKTIELVAQRKNNEEFPLELSLSSLRFCDRWCSVGVMRDISERKQAEESLRRSEQMFRTYFELGLVGMAVTSPEKGWVYVNDNLCKMLGYSRDELKQTTWADLTHPEDLEADVSQFEQVLAGKINSYSMDKRFIRKDGEIVYTNLSLACVRQEDGSVEYFIAHLHDITDRKEAKAALQESENRYRIVVENAGEGIVVVQDGTLRFINPHFTDVTGYSQKEFMSRPFIEFIHPDDREQVMGIHIKRLKGEEVPRAYEFRAIHKQGNTMWLENNGILIEWEGRPASLNFLRDITDRKEAEEALREERDRAQKYLDVAGVMFVHIDTEGKVTLVNKKGCDILGYQESNIVGKNWFDNFLPARNREIVKEVFFNLIAGEIEPVEYYENPILTKDGEERIIAWHNTILREDVKIIGTLSSGEDVTERKKAEAALAESEQRFRKFFENEPEYCYMVSPQGTILEANHAVLDTLGYTMEELAGKPLMTIYAPESYQRMHQLLSQWENTGEIRDEEMVILTKNGDRRTVLLSAAQVLDEDGKLLHSVSIQRDITERKEAEEALRKSEERLKILFESAPDAYYIHDLEGKFVDGNRAAEELLGYQKEETVGESFFELGMVTDADVPKISVAIADNREGKPAGPLELTLNHKDGSKVIVETRSYPVDIAGETLILGIARDITERKKAEEALRAERDKLQALMDGINRAGIGIDIIGADYKVLFQNQTLEERFGKLCGRSCYERYMALEEPCDQCSSVKAIKQNKVVTVEQKGFDGRDYQVFSAPLPGADGSISKAIEIVLDITERKQAERALRDSECFLQNVFDGIRDGLSILDRDLNIVRVNKWMEQMYGTETPLLGRKCYEVYQSRECLCPWCPSVRTIETGEVYVEIVPYPSAENPTRWIELSAFPLKGADGLVVGVIEHVKDVSDRKLTEEALKTSEHRYRAIVEDQTELICRNLPDGTITFVNDAYCRYFDKCQDELVGQKFMPLIPEEDHQKVEEYFASLGPDNPVATYEHRVIMPNGEIRWHQWTNRAIFDDAGNIIEFQGAGRDITMQKMAEEELRENEKRFRSLSEAAFEGIAITEKGVVVDANDAFLKMYGCSLEDIKGTQVMELVAPEHRELVQEKIRSGYEGVYEHKGLRKDGSLIDLEIHGRSIIYQGRTMRLTAIRDITEQKKARLALEAEKKFTENAINAQMDTFFLFEPETGKAIRWNKAFIDISGYNDEEIARMPAPASYYSPEDLERAGAFIQKVLKDGVGTIELELICKDGRKVPTEYWVSIINDDQGEPKYIISIGRDITERKLAEDKVRESEERLTKAFRASPNLMGIFDLDEKRRLLVNEAFARVTGYSIKEMTGTTFDELNFWVEPDRVHEALRFVRKDGILQDYETEIRTKHGEIRTLRYYGAMLDIPGKNFVVFSAEDITEQRKAERRIKEYQAQLKSLASELSLAEERERRRIAAGIHDDIAQKLAMAKFELQSLQASVTDTDVSGSLEKQCQLMDQVVADARSLTFELSNPVLYQVGLEAAVESYMAEQIQGQFGIKCKFKSEGPHSSLEEDIRVVLFQAVRELLANIVKHANASTVEVCVSNTEDRLRIVVQDDGVGFETTEIGPHLVGRGGFGLFNIRERLEYMGGNVKIESRRTKGARVTMTIAMKTDAAAE